MLTLATVLGGALFVVAGFALWLWTGRARPTVAAARTAEAATDAEIDARAAVERAAVAGARPVGSAVERANRIIDGSGHDR